MPRFLFWNVAGNSIGDLVATAAHSNGVDLLVLAECKLRPSQILHSLNKLTTEYQFAFGLCERLMFFTKFQPKFLVPMYESSRISIRRLRLPARSEIIIAAAHLPSKMHFSDPSLSFECIELARTVEQQETIAGHRRTILLGDLNVNPFENGMVLSGGLHAVMSRSVALKKSRIIQSKEYHFFYNPMWSQFGDRPSGPPGTYYYEKAEHLNYYWNIFDQVLLRPDLLGGFDTRSLNVLTTAGATSLLDNAGLPDKQNASDHLPVIFGIDF